MTLKVGDVVKLKSGGPVMTVIVSPKGEDQICSTAWFSGDKSEIGRFPAESLMIYSHPY
jgi:uncharacterized protein YodC (DUF2158 family)